MPVTSKVCPACPDVGPQPAENFGLDGYSASGLRTYCRACNAAQRREHRAKVKQTKPASPTLLSPSLLSPPKITETQSSLVVAIPDTHFPFHNREALTFVLEFIREHQPDLVIQLGDLADRFSYSKYPHSLNVMTPRDEVREAHAWAVWMWEEIQSGAPDARCVQIFGNHDDRVLKRIMERSPDHEDMVLESLRTLHTFEGVESIQGDFEFEGVTYMHGEGRPGSHSQWFQGNTVHGHSHKGTVLLNQNENGVFWELDAGWVGDIQHECFNYYAHKQRSKTTLGFGVVDAYGPRFIPFKG